MFEVTIQREGGSQTVSINKSEMVIGRKNEFQAIDLDLSPDDTVSRVHARVALIEAGVQLEDLGSSLGTTLNGYPVKEPVMVNPQDAIVVGETTLMVSYKATQRGASDVPQPASPKPAPAPAKRKAKGTTAGSPRAAGHRGASQHRPPPGRGAKKPTAKEGYKIQLELELKGKRWAVVVDRPEAIIGRKNEEHQVDVDLSEDLSVSRVHARIWEQDGQCWVEDQGSRHGVKLNGESIGGAMAVRQADKIHVGSTMIRVQLLAAKSIRQKPKPRRKAAATSPLPTEETVGMPVEGRYPVFKADFYPYTSPAARKAGESVDVTLEDSPVGEIRTQHHLSLDDDPRVNSMNKKKSMEYYQGLLSCVGMFSLQTDMEGLGASVVEQVMKMVPGAERVALFLTEAEKNKLVPVAHEPSFRPILSSVLAQEAMADRKGLAWRQCDKEESMRRLPVQAGMYSPLVCGEEECGLLSVDTKQAEFEYAPEDLSLLIAVSQVAAAHVHRLRLQGAGEVD